MDHDLDTGAGRARTPLDAKLDRAVARLAREAAGQRFWAYAIRDPRTGDRRDWTTGDPFFVGQTDDPARRARAHVAATGAEDGEGEPPPHRERLRAILHAGLAPVFELLEPAPTRLAALAAEARWARRFRDAGFDVPAPPEGEELGDTGAPLARVWALPCGEAAAEGVGAEIACDRCGAEAALPLGALAERAGAKTRLSALRDAITCPGCGREGVLRLVAPPG